MSSGSYRYGFNGKENDNDVKDTGNQQDYGMRIYDPRLGKFLSVDPLHREYPWNSTYAFAENDPINFVDLDGLEKGVPPLPWGRGIGPRSGSGPLTGHGNQIGAEELTRFREVNARNQLERDREELNRAREFSNSHPNLSRTVNNWRVQFNAYNRAAFETAGIVFTGGDVRQNYTQGNKWESYVHSEMLKNPNYIGIARQITIHIVGTVNGQTVSAKVRVDDVGVFKENGRARFDLNESKYSVQEITINNIKYALSGSQTTAYDLIFNGSNVQMFMSKGKNSPGKLNSIMENSGLQERIKPGQEITGSISNIILSAPSGKAGTAASPTKPSPTTEQ